MKETPLTLHVEAPGQISRASARKPLRRTDRFYLIMSVLALIIVLAGFFPTYISPMVTGHFVAKPYVHLHGSMFFLWIVAAIVQPFLISAGNIALHRRAGTVLGFFAAAMVVMGVAMAIISARVDIANGDDVRPKAFLLIPLTDMLLFSLFAALGVWFRKRPDDHKRLMLLATVSILPAAFGRLLGNLGLENAILNVLIMDSFLFAGIVNDYFRGRRFHRVYLFGGAVLLAIDFSRIFLSQTESWKSIASWILT